MNRTNRIIEKLVKDGYFLLRMPFSEKEKNDYAYGLKQFFKYAFKNADKEEKFKKLLLRKDQGGKLPLVAEDLGVITEQVEYLRNYFELPGMKILQFAFDGNLKNPYLPENIKGNNWIVYTGTHDNATTSSWWENLNDENKSRILERYKNKENSTYYKNEVIQKNIKTL